MPKTKFLSTLIAGVAAGALTTGAALAQQPPGQQGEGQTQLLLVPAEGGSGQEYVLVLPQQSGQNQQAQGMPQGHPPVAGMSQGMQGGAMDVSQRDREIYLQGYLQGRAEARMAFQQALAMAIQQDMQDQRNAAGLQGHSGMGGTRMGPGDGPMLRGDASPGSGGMGMQGQGMTGQGSGMMQGQAGNMPYGMGPYAGRGDADLGWMMREQGRGEGQREQAMREVRRALQAARTATRQGDTDRAEEAIAQAEQAMQDADGSAMQNMPGNQQQLQAALDEAERALQDDDTQTARDALQRARRQFQGGGSDDSGQQDDDQDS